MRNFVPWFFQSFISETTLGREHAGNSRSLLEVLFVSETEAAFREFSFMGLRRVEPNARIPMDAFNPDRMLRSQLQTSTLNSQHYYAVLNDLQRTLKENAIIYRIFK